MAGIYHLLVKNLEEMDKITMVLNNAYRGYEIYFTQNIDSNTKHIGFIKFDVYVDDVLPILYLENQYKKN